MSHGSLNPKIRFLGQKMCSVARLQTDTQTDTQTYTQTDTHTHTHTATRAARAAHTTRASRATCAARATLPPARPLTPIHKCGAYGMEILTIMRNDNCLVALDIPFYLCMCVCMCVNRLLVSTGLAQPSYTSSAHSCSSLPCPTQVAQPYPAWHC